MSDDIATLKADATSLKERLDAAYVRDAKRVATFKQVIGHLLVELSELKKKSLSDASADFTEDITRVHQAVSTANALGIDTLTDFGGLGQVGTGTPSAAPVSVSEETPDVSPTEPGPNAPESSTDAAPSGPAPVAAEGADIPAGIGTEASNELAANASHTGDNGSLGTGDKGDITTPPAEGQTDTASKAEDAPEDATKSADSAAPKTRRM